MTSHAPPGSEPARPDLADPLLGWYAASARDLPWRSPGVSPWAILVSEVMLQQTPVSRVLPAFDAWMRRWPTPRDLAAAPGGEAVRQWGKLGYPRRALRLRECAQQIVDRFDGHVPDTIDALVSLPGVGAYTARAVATFAFGQRHPVVDTNVRRVVARVVEGAGEPGPPSVTRDLATTEAVLPRERVAAAGVSIALMELGALVCTARAPRCPACPLVDRCAWHAAGRPAYTGPRVRPQRFAGTDRQVRGLLLDVLRHATGPVTQAQLDTAWADPVQRQRALDALVSDGLIDPQPNATYALPS